MIDAPNVGCGYPIGVAFGRTTNPATATVLIPFGQSGADAAKQGRWEGAEGLEAQVAEARKRAKGADTLEDARLEWRSIGIDGECVQP
jgi:hypothetical protein